MTPSDQPSLTPVQPETEGIHYDAADEKVWKRRLQVKDMDLKAGYLGRFFGTGVNCSINIAGLTIVILSLISIIESLVGFYMHLDFDIWKTTVPVISGALGFAFGHRPK